MNIELKNKFKYHFTVALLSFLSLFCGAIGIMYRIEGLLMLPLTSAFIGALISVEKRKIASVTVSALLIVGELIFGFMNYFTFTSLSSVIAAVIISVFYLKKMNKSESAVLSTLLISVMIFVTAVVYIISTTEASTVVEAYEYFVSVYNGFKENVIASVLSMSAESGVENPTLTYEYLNEMFGAYLNCIPAIVIIIAFALVGLAHKIFCKLIHAYSKDSDQIARWQFFPSSAFAYFYFGVLLCTLFAMDTASVIAVSILNLYLIFMFIFAYVGYRFAIALMSSRGKSKAFAHLTVLALILLLSSISLQLLAALGAFEIIKYFKIRKFMDSKKQ